MVLFSLFLAAKSISTAVTKAFPFLKPARRGVTELVLPHTTPGWAAKRAQLTELQRILTRPQQHPVDYLLLVDQIESTLSNWDAAPMHALRELTQRHLAKGTADAEGYLNTVFESIFPAILGHALGIETLSALEPLSLLGAEKSDTASLTISRVYTRCLLAHAFLGTFEDRVDFHACGNYPMFSFARIWESREDFQIEKIKMMLNYFQQASLTDPKGSITILRRRTATLPQLGSVKLTGIEFHAAGKLEDLTDSSHADFANKYVGGGCLTHGCVQEEIRFMCAPELIVSMLVCEKLSDNEALVIQGAQTYSEYTGYAKSLTYAGPAHDSSKILADGSLASEILVMDALCRPGEAQFLQPAIDRNVLKAYCAFLPTGLSRSGSAVWPVSTGNWGCGAFKNDLHMQLFIQWIAASAANRSLHYYLFGAKLDMGKLAALQECFSAQGTTADDVYRHMLRFHTAHADGQREQKLIDYLHNVLVAAKPE